MIAFDTDVLVELLRGNPLYVARVSGIPREEQFVPSVVIEEILRGRLNAIRRAESGKIKLSIDWYEINATDDVRSTPFETSSEVAYWQSVRNS